MLINLLTTRVTGSECLFLAWFSLKFSLKTFRRKKKLKMKFNFAIFVVLFYKQCLEFSVAENCFKYYQKIISRLHQHQITFFLNNSQNVLVSREKANFFRILRQVPHIIVDFKFIIEKNAIFDKSSVNDSVHLSLNIVLSDQNFYQSNSSKSIIDFLAQLCPIQPRQKVLIFLMKNISLSETRLKEIFEYAWFKKFLDFTVIDQEQKMLHTVCTVHHYNPFKNELIREKINFETNLFPENIKNIYGYSAKIGLVRSDIITQKIKDLSGKIVDVDTEKYYLLSTALKKLNFSHQFKEFGINKTFWEGFKVIDDKLANNEINFFVKPRLSHVVSNEHVLINIENDCEKMLAIVPTKSIITKVYVSVDVIINFCFLPTLIIFIYLTVKLLIVKQEKWKIFKIAEIFFGMSKICPKSNVDRIIYMLIIISSSIFSINFYSRFLEIGLAKNEDMFNTLRNINESNLNIYAFKGYYNSIFTGSDAYVQSIKYKTKKADDAIPCLEELALYDDRICIVRENFLKLFVKYHPTLRNYEFTVAKPTFNCVKIYYSFEKSSPYTKKFNSIFRYIHESGIKRILEPKSKLKKDPRKLKEQTNAVNFFLASLICILILGYTASIIVFFAECAKNF